MGIFWRGIQKFQNIEAVPGGQVIGFGTPSPPGGVWYVDSNAGNDSYNGLSWLTCKKTIAAAVTLANAEIAASSLGWAARPTIYYKGDNNTEILTSLPNKTDIIGVGSSDGNEFPVLVGAQVPTTGMGTRFINMGFREEAGVAFTIPTGVSGITFLGCYFLGSAAGTIGILATASTDLKIQRCVFFPWADQGGWSTAAISLATGTAHRTLILDNIIANERTNGGDGILVNSGRSGAGSYIARNLIDCKTICIDDNSNTFHVHTNRGSTLANEGDTCVDINEAISTDNLFGAADAYTAYPIFPKDNFTTTT